MESDRPGDRPNDRPNDRRGELLDRAYRRGYALRRRRRWTATLAGLAVVAVVAAGVTALVRATGSRKVSVVQPPTTTTDASPCTADASPYPRPKCRATSRHGPAAHR